MPARTTKAAAQNAFVAAPTDAPARVLGFYTLSPASLEYSRTPALAKKGLAEIRERRQRGEVDIFESRILQNAKRAFVHAKAQLPLGGGAGSFTKVELVVQSIAPIDGPRAAHQRQQTASVDSVRNIAANP